MIGPPAAGYHARIPPARQRPLRLNTASSPALLPWVLGTLSAILLFAAAVLAWMVQRRQERRLTALEWSLTSRPVFNADERKVYRLLREALPHHVVLAKLPLLRFCQPTDPQDIPRWARRLANLHVSFAICSANGRVLAALDVEGARSHSRRSQQLKQAVLAACRIRYLRCAADMLPSVPELQLLVPQASPLAQAPQAAGWRPADRARGPEGRLARPRAPLWDDSGFSSQDSFFGTSAAQDPAASEFGMLRAANEFPGPDDFDDPVDDHHDESHRPWRQSRH